MGADLQACGLVHHKACATLQLCTTCQASILTIELLFGDAGKFWVNVNWVMACIFTAWIVVTIAYYVVRATQSLNHLNAGTFVYAVWVLVVEVGHPPAHITLFPDHLIGVRN